MRPDHGTALTAFFLHLFHRVVCLAADRTGLHLFHPKYPPVIWFPEFPMFNNRTNPARIVVQMQDSLDFFCPDYINSQYQSFTGAKKLPSEYGAEEIYMVDGQDYQSCFAGLSRGRLAKQRARLLLRCPGKTADTSKTKAKFQYTVSFRMFSPVPKGPEFACNQEYYFLGIFPGHNHNEEAIEKALCSTNALRLQIFVSCSDNSHHSNNFDTFPSLNVIQLDRPAQPSDTATTTPPSALALAKSALHSTGGNAEPGGQPASNNNHNNNHNREASRSSGKARPSRPSTPSPAGGVYVARSDRKIMRQPNAENSGSEIDNSRQSPARRLQSTAMATRSPSSGPFVTRSPDDDRVDRVVVLDRTLDRDHARLLVEFDEEPAGGDRVASSTTSTGRSAAKPSLKHLALNYSSRGAASTTRLHFLYTIFSLILAWSIWPPLGR